jgi:LmbE family N-acetylglucosaminyl deacetylase
VSVLILAPHPDDAALCLGGSLAAWRLRDPSLLAQARLVTVFGRSVYAPYAKLPAGENPLAAVSALRAREEREFAAACGLRLQLLDLPDSSAIGLSDQEEVAAEPGLDPRLEEVAAALSAPVGQAEVLLVCAAIGGHVDHRLVRDLALAATRASLAVLYEDLPYATEICRGSAPPPDPALTVLAPDLDEGWLDIGGVLDLKRERLRSYRSQLSRREIASVIAHASSFAPMAAYERVWTAVRDPGGRRWLQRLAIEPATARVSVPPGG